MFVKNRELFERNKEIFAKIAKRKYDTQIEPGSHQGSHVGLVDTIFVASVVNKEKK